MRTIELQCFRDEVDVNVIEDCSTAAAGCQGYWYGMHGRVARSRSEVKVECKPAREYGPNAPGTRSC